MNEFVQGILHAAQANQGESRTGKWGRIASYDGDKHAVRVVIDEDEDEEACETDWITLGTIAVGDRTGIQWAPIGGATMDNQDGETCKISILDPVSGHMVCTLQGYTEKHRPPAGEASEEEKAAEEEEDPEDKKGWDDDPKGRKKLEGGEGIIRHKSGSFLKFYDDGSMQLYPAKDLHLYTKENANVVVREGDLNATVEKGNLNTIVKEGDIDVSVEQGNTTIDTVLGNTTISSVAGNIDAKTEEGDITATATAGNITASALAGNITAECLTAEVLAEGLINLLAPVVNAGIDPGSVQKLCNEAFLLLFNNHIHPAPGGVTGAPTNPALPDVETTVNFAAT